MENVRLRQQFSMIRERNEILEEIKAQSKLLELYNKWTEEQQEEFLDSCTGVRGIKLLYDGFFKEIMDPEQTPERLSEFLSLLLGKKVKVLRSLPNDSTRIASESSLLIMDIVVEFEDGSIANIEVQRIGYLFPGQRAACYSSDLLLRQYKRVRGEKGKKFSYKDIHPVYTIVLYEQSPEEFREFPDAYIHRIWPESDTGLKLDLLQNYVFIPLDIFRKNQHNKDIRSKLDAWIAFLCMDDPEMIIRLIEQWPEFRPMYEQAYEMCRNVEGVMGIFSKELEELDRNTVQYMIDELQERIDQKKVELNEKQAELSEAQTELSETQTELNEKKAELNEKQTELNEAQTELSETQTELNVKKAENAELREENLQLLRRIAELEKAQGR